MQVQKREKPKYERSTVVCAPQHIRAADIEFPYEVDIRQMRVCERVHEQTQHARRNCALLDNGAKADKRDDAVVAEDALYF